MGLSDLALGIEILKRVRARAAGGQFRTPTRTTAAGAVMTVAVWRECDDH